VRESVLTAAESIVTYRRRYRSRSGTDALVELLVVDQHNPRSVAYQLARVQSDLQALPTGSPTARPLRLLEALVEKVRTADPTTLTIAEQGLRPALAQFLADLHEQLRDLAEAIRTQYQQRPPTQQPLFRQAAAGRLP
jgi:uncharacterized alpha-E superfamily protein